MTTRQRLVLAAGALSAATLAGAFFFQYVVGILPCHLCILQRWPHALMVALAALAWFVPLRLLALAGAALSVVSLGLGIYHSGVERKLWAGPSDCTGGIDLSGMSGADLLDTTTASPIVACDRISWEILGITFANANVLLSLALIALWWMAARRS